MIDVLEKEQMELFPSLQKTDIKKTLFYLKKYPHMKALIRDYEQFQEELAETAVDGESGRRIDEDEVHADKTANATILAQKQRWVYEQYKTITRQVERAYGMILDVDAKNAVKYRYLEGYSYKEMILFFRHELSDSTIERRLREGEMSIANTLKLWGVLDVDWKY